MTTEDPPRSEDPRSDIKEICGDRYEFVPPKNPVYITPMDDESEGSCDNHHVSSFDEYLKSGEHLKELGNYKK